MKIKPFILALFLVFPVLANALTSEDEKQIILQMHKMQANINQNSVKVFNQYPPKVIEALANEIHVPKNRFAQVIALSHIKFVTIKSMSFDLKKGNQGHTPYRDYIVFPVLFQKVSESESTYTNEDMIALTDNQRWYIYFLNDSRAINLVENAYPDLKDIPISNNTKWNLISK